MGNVNQPAFQPDPGATVNLTAGVASSNVQVQSDASRRHVRVYNSGSVTAFIRFGAANTVAAAVASDYPVAPGTIEILTAPHPWVAAITASGTAVVYFTPGEGL